MSDERVHIGDLKVGDIFSWAGRWVTIQSITDGKTYAQPRGRAVKVVATEDEDRLHALHYFANEWVTVPGVVGVSEETTREP